MVPADIIPTRNAYGWTSAVPNQITCEVVRALPEFGARPVVLDIGAGLGVATLPLLEAGARVVANDIEICHLAAISNAAAKSGRSEQLTTVLGKFPEELSLDGLDAVHCSNVLHFLRGNEIVAGAQRIHEWLRPGGRVFVQVGTIFAGHIRELAPEFERRRRAGVVWAGETYRARDFVLPAFRDLTPEFMNYLDGPPVVEAFESAGFITERAWYYTRYGLPEVFVNDGREHFGYIGRKPSAQERR
jgi:SAM-dependent methyltransferase